MELYAEVEREERREKKRRDKLFFLEGGESEKCAGWRMGIYVVCFVIVLVLLCLCLCFYACAVQCVSVYVNVADQTPLSLPLSFPPHTHLTLTIQSSMPFALDVYPVSVSTL